MELEFIALNKTVEEAKWLIIFLQVFLYSLNHFPTISVHCDNQAAISRAQSSFCNGKFRHIRRSHNIVHQLVKDRVIAIDYVKSSDNIANPLTK